MSRKKKSAESSSGEAQTNPEAQHYASGAENGSEEFNAGGNGNEPTPEEKPAPVELRNETRQLRVELSEHERNELKTDVTRNTLLVSQLEEDKKASASDFKSRIDRIKSDIKRAATLANTGHEVRPVECRVTGDDPDPGFKTVYRKDTGEKIETVAMSPFEKQLLLPLGEPAKKDTKPVIAHTASRSGVVVLPSEQDDFSDPEDNKPNF